MHNKTVSELIDDIKNKKVSSLELTKHFISRIKKLDKNIMVLLVCVLKLLVLMEVSTQEHLWKVK